MKVCILSGRYPETKFSSPINHKIYADRFGYTYIHCNFPTQAQNPYFNKIYYILSYIDAYDYIVWIDDDAFFLDFNKDIMVYAPENDKFISLCKSPSFKELKTFLSSGQFIFKCNALSKQFFRELLSLNLKDIKTWWRDELGYFSNGDQDAMIYLLLEKEEYKKKYKLYNYKEFNSRVENLFGEDPHKLLIIHFTDKPYDKMVNYRKVQKEFNWHKSLVKYNLLNEYGVVLEKKIDFSLLKSLKRKIKHLLKIK